MAKPNALENFIAKVKAVPEITECYIITGDADFILKIVCKDIPNYEKLLYKTLSQIEEIERLKTLMTLSKVKIEKFYLTIMTMQRTLNRGSLMDKKKGEIKNFSFFSIIMVCSTSGF